VTHEVKTTIIGNESGNLLSVLDELDTDTLSDSRVGLLGLNTDLDSQHDVPFVHFMSSIVPCVSSILANIASSSTIASNFLFFTPSLSQLIPRQKSTDLL
jgi:hypothetical protein